MNPIHGSVAPTDPPSGSMLQLPKAPLLRHLERILSHLVIPSCTQSISNLHNPAIPHTSTQSYSPANLTFLSSFSCSIASRLLNWVIAVSQAMAPALLLASSFIGSKFPIPLAVQERVPASIVSPGIIVCQQKDTEPVSTTKISRRETLLRSSSSAMLLAFLNFGGERPEYLGVQSNPPSLALCPPTPSCISTSEELNDPGHYVPPWTYNPKDGRGRKNPASKEKAMAELIDVIKSEKPDNFTPRIVKQTDDYVYVEYSSPLVGFVDDVEFWFPPGDRSLVEYRSASRREGIDFGFNRKRIKALRQALERYGWESIGF